MANYVAKYPPHATGYATRTVLWHALNEGTVTAATVAGLSGISAANLNQCMLDMANKGLLNIVPTALAPASERRYRAYGLTPKGMETALLINEADVEFAKPDATEATA